MWFVWCLDSRRSLVLEALGVAVQVFSGGEDLHSRLEEEQGSLHWASRASGNWYLTTPVYTGLPIHTDLHRFT